nr:tetratricopeptide repeat protein [candidate division KSB1 bacterium]NIV68837.1 hypothetical protein [Phycisphaerae bacterium]NIR68679.1 tetratricopeptide repeat protein [candidate division KSB1 bacterium]NIS25498.1 tetratricopeptide repeat protein [candidate division KSB1 bacterium]NIT72387.1 tetratricopeptide repeat protein [candidate division KSB1 bacterium]
IYDARGDYETALNYLKDSLKIQQEIGDKSGEMTVLHNMAMISRDKEDYEAYLQQEIAAYELAKETTDANGLYRIGWELGTFLCEVGEQEQGLPLLQTSLRIGRQAGFPDVADLEALIKKHTD